jgi:hypothetical protein
VNEISRALPARCKLVLFNPMRCWDSIAAENTPWQDLLRFYTLPLAVVGGAASFLDLAVIGVWDDSGHATAPIAQTLMFCIGCVIAVLVFHLVAAQLCVRAATALGGSCELDAAMRLVAHAATPLLLGWSLSFPLTESLRSITSLYSLVLLYTGSGPLLRLPREQQAIFTAAAFFAGALAVGFLTFLCDDLIPRGN